MAPYRRWPCRSSRGAPAAAGGEANLVPLVLSVMLAGFYAVSAEPADLAWH